MLTFFSLFIIIAICGWVSRKKPQMQKSQIRVSKDNRLFEDYIIWELVNEDGVFDHGQRGEDHD